MVKEAGIRDTVDLAEGELDALVAFLNSLTGQIDQEYIVTADNRCLCCIPAIWRLI